jgi:acetylglutamate kinase
MRQLEDATVVKLGGSLLEDRRLRGAALAAIAARFTAGELLVVVHGGGLRIDRNLKALGIPKKTHQGLRVTDAETLDVVVSALAGVVNKSLVAEMEALGVSAAGISGADGGTLHAEFHPRLGGVDLGFVGRVSSSNPTLVRSIFGGRMLPIVASVALGRDGTLLNVNADEAASALAVSLQARRLVFFTDVEGLLDEEGNLVERIGPAQARALLQSEAVKGGMRPKLNACLSALAAGVREVVIAGPNRHASVLSNGMGGTILVAA